jgi:nitric oxide reductase large subunit
MMIVVVLPLMGFWIYALVDCVKHEPETGNERLVWILVIALAGWIGALVYWFVRRPQRTRLLGR